MANGKWQMAQGKRRRLDQAKRKEASEEVKREIKCEGKGKSPVREGHRVVGVHPPIDAQNRLS